MRAKRHRPGERRHLAVVDDFERHVVPRLAHLEEEVLDACVEDIGRHAAEEGACLDPVVDVNAGGAAADRVDPGQMRGSLPERVHDAVEVILGIRLVVRIPHRFVTEDHASIDHRGRLAVAAAEIESDPAAVQVAAEWPGDRAFRRQFACGDDLDRMIENPPADEVGIKPARGCRDIVRRERGGKFRRSVDVNPPSAPGPEEKLHQSFDVRVVRRGMRMRGGQYRRFEMEDRAIGLFESEPDRNPGAARGDEPCERTRGEHGRAKSRIEGRGHARGGKREVTDRVHGWRLTCALSVSRGFRRSPERSRIQCSLESLRAKERSG